ncbi:MAG: hypothetical protein IJU92_07455 [Spirochaetaceae bacterium]|nr:hypothetical protein [Spirochaetaceae bacterium]
MKKSLLLLLGVFVLCGTVLLGCNSKVEPANKTNDSILEISAIQSTTTSNAVEITWRTSVKSYKYYIYYNSENNPLTATICYKYGAVGEEYDSSFKKTGFFKGSEKVSLSESGTYYFWVKGVSKDNVEGNFSKVASCNFTASKLSTPIDITASQSETSYNNVTVTWRDTLKASKYYIYYSKTNDPSTATKYSLFGVATDEYDASFNKTGFYKGSQDISLSESGTYYFWVKGVDGTGKESDFSTSSNCSFTYATLNAPIDVTVAISTTDSSKLTVSWRDEKKANKYYIYYSTTNDSSTATKYSLFGVATDEYDSSFNKTGFYKGSRDIPLSESGTHYFWVKGVDGTNHESDFSTVATYTINLKKASSSSLRGVVCLPCLQQASDRQGRRSNLPKNYTVNTGEFWC